jgi:redox-sensitive bicupin YhaK (pirin superfamily)
MEKIIHRASERGSANHGWLKSQHSFSFANYYNPQRMGFGLLRVINDDVVDPGYGFPTHPHRDMEIVSVPLKGALKHEDTMGNRHVIQKGEVQVMSAGTGVAHSEYNNSEIEEVNFLQIWVIPKKMGIEPRYSQKMFSEEKRENKLQLVVSPDGREGSVEINQDAYFSLAKLSASQSLHYEKYKKENGLYLLVLEGSVQCLEEKLDKKDAMGILDFETLKITAESEAELLFIEVPLD